MDAKSGASSAKGGKPDYYFDSYSHFGIHEEMLKDEVRTTTYMRSILQNRHLFKGKTVLDIGCGTGILCVFAAKAGAKKVIGIDCAEIYYKAKEIVKDNGFEDTITLIKGKVEEIKLPVEKVDIIISEWMGYFLLYESMLDTVLYARDKWLVKGGAIFPDKASMYVMGLEDAEYRASKLEYWSNVWSFDLSPVRELTIQEPLVETCDFNQVLSKGAKFFDIDIYTVTKEDLDFEKKRFEFKINRTDRLDALCVYFRVDFSRCHKPISFSTGPQDKYTHWKQTVFYLEKYIPVKHGDIIAGYLSCKRNAKNPRDLDINLEVAKLSGSVKKKLASQTYHIR